MSDITNQFLEEREQAALEEWFRTEEDRLHREFRRYEIEGWIFGILFSLVALSGKSYMSANVPTHQARITPSNIEIMSHQDGMKRNQILKTADGRRYLMGYDPKTNRFSLVPYPQSSNR